LSLNLTNINITPMHVAFDEASEKARDRGIRVTGSELVGLVPLKAMLDAGKYFLKKQQRSGGVSDKELIKIAIKSLGLDDLKPFHPNEKIIEYMIDQNSEKKLVKLDLNDFANETSSESPAPGGGSISAYVGALGVSLGIMVANLSSHKRGWDERWDEFSEWAEKGMEYQKSLLLLVDEDTKAFNKIMEAFGLPKGSEDEKSSRKEAIESATKYATEVPFKVLEICYKSMEIMKAMAEFGNPNSVSDAGVGALCARAAVRGALLNVKINAGGLLDQTFAKEVVSKGDTIAKKAEEQEVEILKIVEEKL